MFGLIPFADVVRRSFFQTVDGSFVGISNYVQVIKNDAFNLAAKNTLRFVVTCIPCLLLLSLILALLLQQVLILAEKKKKHRDVTMEQFYRGSAAALKSMYLLPMAIPAASVVVLWKILFDSHGFVNSAIHALSGMSGIGQILNVLSVQEVDWMNTDAAFGILVFSYVWKYLGYDIVLWMAGLSAIPQGIYEAAEMDGAGKWKQAINITLPCIVPTIIIQFILSSSNILNAGFDQIFMLYTSHVYDVADIIDTYVYRQSFMTGTNFGYTTAIGLLKSVIGVVMIWTANKVTTKLGEDGLF